MASDCSHERAAVAVSLGRHPMPRVILVEVWPQHPRHRFDRGAASYARLSRGATQRMNADPGTPCAGAQPEHPRATLASPRQIARWAGGWPLLRTRSAARGGRHLQPSLTQEAAVLVPLM